MMHKNVAHADDFLPRYFRVGIGEFLRNIRGRLADNLQMMHDPVLDQFIMPPFLIAKGLGNFFEN